VLHQVLKTLLTFEGLDGHGFRRRDLFIH